MTALECMALGKPVIAGAHTPGMREILDDGRAGLVTDVANPEDIAAAMLTLQTDALAFDELARAAYARAHSTYLAETIVTQYERLYLDFEASIARGS